LIFYSIIFSENKNEVLRIESQAAEYSAKFIFQKKKKAPYRKTPGACK